jgi:cellulose biosynthesis protein BcsQ
VEKGFAPEFIAFYSVCGGSGNTACAFGTSKELSRYHDKKVLYLSFEEMPASELMIRYHARSLTIGDYLYYLLETNNISLCCHPEGFTSSDDCGVESFSPSVGLNDLNDLSQEELIAFLKIISDSSRYDYVILDFNNRLSDETLFLMNLCSIIVVLLNDHPVSEYRTRKLIAYLTKQSNFADKNRFLRVVNQAGPEFPEPIGETGCKTICIEKDDNSFRYSEDHFEIDINHAFGIGIKKIADEIILVESGKEGAKCTGSFVQ